LTIGIAGCLSFVSVCRYEPLAGCFRRRLGRCRSAVTRAADEPGPKRVQGVRIALHGVVRGLGAVMNRNQGQAPDVPGATERAPNTSASPGVLGGRVRGRRFCDAPPADAGLESLGRCSATDRERQRSRGEVGKAAPAVRRGRSMPAAHARRRRSSECGTNGTHFVCGRSGRELTTPPPRRIRTNANSQDV
jgi:hypothetical protein